MCIGGGAKGPQKYSASQSDGHDARDDMSQESRDAHAQTRANASKPTAANRPVMRGGSAPRGSLLGKAMDKVYPRG